MAQPDGPHLGRRTWGHQRAQVIDSHCHAGHGDGLNGPWDDAPLHDYERRARAAGIDRTVLFAALSSDYRSVNREVARVVTANRRRYLGFVFVNPQADRGVVAQVVERYVDQHGFKGIKVHWSNGQITREIAEAARRRRLPVIYDPRGDTATVEMVARTFPDVAWIIPHFSSFADDWKAQVAFVDQLVRHPNVFADTSGVRYYELIVDAVRRAGPHKVLFGSDGPMLHPGVEVAKLRLLGLPRPQEALVLGGNLLRLIRHVRRQRRSGSA